MNIYDPPMAYQTQKTWRKYLNQLKRSPREHADEIARTKEKMVELFGEV